MRENNKASFDPQSSKKNKKGRNNRTIKKTQNDGCRGGHFSINYCKNGNITLNNKKCIALQIYKAVIRASKAY